MPLHVSHILTDEERQQREERKARDRQARESAERRAVEVKQRKSSDNELVLRGYASVFNRWTTLYRSKDLVVRERILPGAFSHALAEKQDVVLNYNHDNDYLIARTASGTLQLREDDQGLAVIAKLDSGSSFVRDRIISPVRRGDLTGMSFAFLPREGGMRSRREDDRTTGQTLISYEVASADLFDVSVVVHPAYQDATFNVRTAGELRHQFLMRSSLLLAELGA